MSDYKGLPGIRSTVSVIWCKICNKKKYVGFCPHKMKHKTKTKQNTLRPKYVQSYFQLSMLTLQMTFASLTCLTQSTNDPVINGAKPSPDTVLVKTSATFDLLTSFSHWQCFRVNVMNRMTSPNMADETLGSFAAPQVLIPYARIILRMRPANERWCYSVTPSLIGWVPTQNDTCIWDINQTSTRAINTGIN